MKLISHAGDYRTRTYGTEGLNHYAYHWSRNAAYTSYSPSDSRYTFRNPKAGKRYMQVLEALISGGPMTGYEIRTKVWGYPEQPATEIINEGKPYAYEKRCSSHTVNCGIFTAMHNAKMIDYNRSTRKWSITEMGKAYYEKYSKIN